ncbi:MAG: hypothetical protein PF495_03020, partial [Spirochaetales bacterium]|nr:hypothetical protein [Spirochaetales bacterium]
MKKIETIDLVFLQNADYEDLKQAMIEAYENMPSAFWKEHHISTLISLFPEGQVMIKINGEFAGCALSIVVDYSKFDSRHSYKDITGNFSFNTH